MNFSRKALLNSEQSDQLLKYSQDIEMLAIQLDITEYN